MIFVAVSAWLSLCLLLIGWLPELDQTFRPVWLISGLIGLISAVGLSELIKVDISTQNRLLSEYRNAALTDGLTGLANRQALESALRNSMAAFSPQRNPLSLIMLDIDNFKAFNDRWGHEAGDVALKAVSQAAHDFFVSRGCVARYGGEEFAVALPSMHRRESLKLADEFRKCVSELDCKFRNETLKITISAGVAEAKEKESLDDFVRRADEALYAAKRSGRNCTRLSEHSEASESPAERVAPNFTLS